MIPHWVTDAIAIAAPLVGALYFVLQLIVRNEQAATNTLIREHIAGDTQKHLAIDSHLEYTDSRIDRLEARKT